MPGLTSRPPCLQVLHRVCVLTGDHNVMEVKHRESGLAGQIDNRPSGHQLQLLLRGVYAMLTNR